MSGVLTIRCCGDHDVASPTPTASAGTAIGTATRATATGTGTTAHDEIGSLTAEFGLLAHPVRLQLLAELAASRGPVCVCDLERAVPVKQPTVSHHLKLLRSAGLVESEKRGQWAYYRLRTAELDRLRQRLVAGLDRVTGRAGGAALRSARASDLVALRTLLRGADLPEAGVSGELDGFVVAEDAGVLVGAAGLEVHGKAGLLRSVVVAEAWRGRGLGAVLAEDRLRRARELGLGQVYLLTTTASSWFPRLGFVEVERDSVPDQVRSSQEFAEVCPVSAVVMAVDLAAAADVTSLKESVRRKYGEAAQAVSRGATASCCGPSSCCGGADEVWDPITSDLYAAAEAAQVPAEAMLASLGCGNPTALARLEAGQTVLDLGSGGGIDVLLSARRVGPTGKAYGLDMTDEMLELARSNQAKAGVTNVEFLKGDIESIPLPDNSVDVVISNCVINLAADKAQVLRETFRVLRPGGRVAVSDIVARREVPAPLRRSMELWVGCVAGALLDTEYERLLLDAGFTDVSLETTRAYRSEDVRHFLESAALDTPDVIARIDELDGAFTSAFVRAVKPAGANPA
jgi:arsenite methyltransferase